MSNIVPRSASASGQRSRGAAVRLLGLSTACLAGAPPGKVASGVYECWAFSSPRPLLNFKVVGSGQYTSPEGERGAFSFDAASGRITFKGGHLDGAMPDGFVAVYHEPGGRPTVSFRSARGSEASFCERIGP